MQYIIEALCGLLLLPISYMMRKSYGKEDITIVGWYGSETVGDVAVLGEILNELRIIFPNHSINLVSFNSKLTHTSLEWLGESENIKICPLGFLSALSIMRSKYVVIGGGPLMESPSMAVWALRCSLIKITGGKQILYACGVGPIRSKSCKSKIKTILKNSNIKILRDKQFEHYFKNEDVLSENTLISFDPALNYVVDMNHQAKNDNKTNQSIALFLRRLPNRYLDGHKIDVDKYYTEMADFLNKLVKNKNARFVGLVMQDDDRLVYEEIQKRMKDSLCLSVAPEPHSLEYIIKTLSSAESVVSLRFHGMIFSIGLNKKFIAVDYTAPKGKITASATAAGYAESVLKWSDLSSQNLMAKMNKSETSEECLKLNPQELKENRINFIKEILKKT